MRPTFPEAEQDYEIRQDGVSIGRIYFAVHVASGPAWFWTYWRNGVAAAQKPSDRGFAWSFDDAKAEIKRRVIP